MAQRRFSPQEVVSRGDEIYQKRIRSHVEQGNEGKFVVIDIETGDYELDSDDLAATKRLLAKHQDALTYGLRIGFPAAYTLGSHCLAGEQ